jgi:hypothetical protein
MEASVGARQCLALFKDLLDLKEMKQCRGGFERVLKKVG